MTRPAPIAAPGAQDSVGRRSADRRLRRVGVRETHSRCGKPVKMVAVILPWALKHRTSP